MLVILAASIVAAGQTFTCTPTHVWDGDGPVWCAEGPHLRIAGIAAREMDDTCRSNQPCPSASAVEARDALVGLLGGPRGTISTGHVVVRGPRLTCRSEGSAGGSRTAAWCRLPSGTDLSCAMVRTGTVLRWDRYWKGPACR
jgi:endonuclease YncB( thermonuclease family)